VFLSVIFARVGNLHGAYHLNSLILSFQHSSAALLRWSELTPQAFWVLGDSAYGWGEKPESLSLKGRCFIYVVLLKADVLFMW
jgi:hypothetical protein